jgi:hypothetical protein
VLAIKDEKLFSTIHYPVVVDLVAHNNHSDIILNGLKCNYLLNPFLLYLMVSRVFFYFDHFTDGRTPWTSDQLVARPLPKHRVTQTQNKHIHIPNIHKHNRPLWVAVQGLIRPTPYTYIPNIHALCRIWTHDPGFRASEGGTWLRPLGYRDRQTQLHSK